MRPFYFRGDNDRMSFCGLTLLRAGPDAMIVVITELPTNPGTPVSDVFEKLATLLFESRIIYLKVPPEGIIWIEHLPADGSAEQGVAEEKWCQVVIEWDGKRYHSPRRVPLPPDTMRQMLNAG